MGEKKKLIPTDLGIITNDFLEKNFGNIIESNFTSLLEENLDSIANNNMVWNNVVKDFYDIFILSVNNLDNKELISKNKNDRKRYLGDDSNKNPIYAYVGKYGPVIQIGDIKDIKYIKIDPKYNVDKITLEEFNEMNQYPKKMGVYKDKDIYLKNGTYGFYISYDDKNYKISNDDQITLEEAIEYIEEQIDKKVSIKIDKFIIKDGPYGMYILYNKKFFSIPKEYNIEKLTKEDCENIIKIPKKKFVKNYNKKIDT